MSCCGKKRNHFQQQQPFAAPVETQIIPNIRPDVYFEYTGETGLSVKGYHTGRLYRFNYKGDIQPVDFRDANSMIGIPVLKMRKDR